MKIEQVFYLPSGRIFLLDCDDYKIECTEMRDVKVEGKEHKEVRSELDARKIWTHLEDYKNKWLLTVSTQKGCSFNCKFCDVAPLPFKGNLSAFEILNQVDILIKNTPYVTKSKKVKIGFARMGEPACNLDNVLSAIEALPFLSDKIGVKFNWLPCFNTILPSVNAKETIDRVIETKEDAYNGFLHFQISCNSTNEKTRQKLFGGASIMPLDEIISCINIKDISNRTITLNFIVMEGVEVDVIKLKKLGLNKEKFVVKLIPLNHTSNADYNNLKTYANYNNLEKLKQLEQDFKNENIPVVSDAIARCEEAGLCCGQLAQIYQ